MSQRTDEEDTIRWSMFVSLEPTHEHVYGHVLVANIDIVATETSWFLAACCCYRCCLCQMPWLAAHSAIVDIKYPWFTT